MAFKCDCGKEHTDIVSKQRFDEVYKERKTLKTKVTEVEGERDAAVAASSGADALKLSLEQAKEQLATSEARYQTHVTISGYGITDPDTVRAIEFFAPKDADLGATLAAWREKPESAPTPLRPLFAAPAPPAPAATPPGTPPGTPPATPPGTPPAPVWPNVNSGAVPTPPAAPTTTDFGARTNAQLQADLNDPNSEFAKALNTPMRV